MGYLVLQRRVGEEIILTVQDHVSDAELVRQLRGDGIQIIVSSIQGACIRLAFSAHGSIKILREELIEY